MEHDVMGYEDRFIMPMPLYYMSIMEMRCNIESKAIFLNIFSSVAQGKSSWEDEMVCLKRSIFVRCREVRILLIIDTGGIFLSLMTMMSPLYFPPLLHRYWTSFLYLNVGEMMTRAFVDCIMMVWFYRLIWKGTVHSVLRCPVDLCNITLGMM